MGVISRIKRESMYANALGMQFLMTRKRLEKNLDTANTRFGQIYFRTRDSDLAAICQTMGDREYDLKKFPQYIWVEEMYQASLAAGRTPLIVDAGANIGSAAIWFSIQFPMAKIVAVEPDPNNARICKMNTAGRNVEVLEAAIGATSGTVSLVSSDHSWAIQTKRGGSIPVVTINQIQKSNKNSDLLIVKIDIEGFESDLFSNSLEWIDESKVIIVEPHDWMLPGSGSSNSFRSAIGSDFDMLISGENLVFVKR